VLLVDVLRRRIDREGITPTLLEDLAYLDRRGTGGKLHAHLKGLGVEQPVLDRIKALIERRNDLIHHLPSDPVIARAMMGGETEMDVAVAQVEQLALDCAVLAVELGLPSTKDLEKLVGGKTAELWAQIAAADPAKVPDSLTRRELEAIQAVGPLDFDELAASLFEQPGSDEEETGQIGFAPSAVYAALGDHMAWYLEHHTPTEERPERIADPPFDDAVEKLLQVNPGLTPRDALREGIAFGFAVGATVATRGDSSR
jgi:hypothetical protein